MIQRPQSIFLLVIIITLITTTLVPIWAKTEAATAYIMNAWCFQEVSPEGKLVNGVYSPYALVGLLTLTAAGIATYELFRYDNRAMQLKLGALNALVMVALIGLILYLTMQKEAHLLPDVPGKYQLGFFLLTIAVACNLLANRFIRKDEKLIRSADRMR